jgi:hypothetical protein
MAPSTTASLSGFMNGTAACARTEADGTGAA